MSVEKNKQLLLDLIEGNPSDANDWFDNVETKRIDVDPEFNWTLLVSQFTTNAHQHARLKDKETSLSWARLAVRVYPFVSKLFSESSIAFSNECSEMYLRAGLINNFGVVNGDKILDPKIIIEWFFDNLEMSLEEAKSESIRWKNMTHEEKINFIKTSKLAWFIVNIRNRLNVTKLLIDNGNIILDSELEKWFDFRNNFAY